MPNSTQGDNIMNAIFNKNSSSKKYQWKNLGNISIGRPDLGDTVPVAIYRQLEFSLIEVLTRRYGSKEANDIFIMNKPGWSLPDFISILRQALMST